MVITKRAGNSGNWHCYPLRSLESLYTLRMAYTRGVRKKAVRTQDWWGRKTNGNTELVMNSCSYIVYPSQAKGENEISNRSHCVGLEKNGNLPLSKMAILEKVNNHITFLLVRKQARPPAL